MVKRGHFKKGLSSIITMLLIILMVLIAIFIIWVVIKNVTFKGSELTAAQQEFLREDMRISSIRSNQDFVNIYVKRTTGSLDIITTENTSGNNATADMDIISVVDISGSMCTCKGVSQSCCQNNLRGDYVGGECMGVNSNMGDACTSTCGGIWVDRLSYAKNANKELIKILANSDGNRIGLVVYSSNVNSSASIDLTADINQLNQKIDSWQAGGSTCICCAINDAVRRLQNSPEDKLKRIIVMSDGEANVRCNAQNTGDAISDATKAACDAKTRLSNVLINSVGAGDRVNEQALRDIADCGGGTYFSAVNLEDLVIAYQNIAQSIIVTNYTSTSSLSYIYFVFYSGDVSYREKVTDFPNPLVIKTYQFNMTGKLPGELTKIEIYPVVITPSGKEVIGPMFDSWEF